MTTRMTKRKKSTLTKIFSVVFGVALGAGIISAFNSPNAEVDLAGDINGMTAIGVYAEEALEGGAEETTPVTGDYTAFPSKVAISQGNQYLLIIVGIDNVNEYNAIDLQVLEHGKDVDVDLKNTYYTGIRVRTSGDETKLYTIDDLFADAEVKPNGMIVHEVPYVEDLPYEIIPSLTQIESKGGATLFGATKEIVARKLYELTLYDAILEGAEGETQPDGGVKYQVAYDTALNMQPEVDSGEMFIAWKDEFGNYFGDYGNAEYQENMPREALEAHAVVGPFTAGFFTKPSIQGYTSSATTVDGLGGYKVTIPAGTQVATDNPENIQGSTFDSAVTGSKLMKAAFKNDGTEDVTVEVYATFYGVKATTGYVTVPAGQKITEYFTVGTGINDPWWGFAVRSNTTSEIPLEFGIGYAPLYPDGDPAYKTNGDAQYVTLGNAAFGGAWENSRPTMLNNDIGVSAFAAYDHVFSKAEGFLTRKITNMPAGTGRTVYAKIGNNVNTRDDLKTNYRFVISTTSDPLTSAIVSKPYTAAKGGQINVLKLDIPDSATGELFFSVVKEKGCQGSSSNLYGMALSMTLTYNDVLGYSEQWVHTALATAVGNGEGNGGDTSWLSGEFVTLENGLTATKFTIKANTPNGADATVQPNQNSLDQLADANGFNVRIPIYGKTVGKRTIKFTVTNHHATQDLAIKVYTPNWGLSADDSVDATIPAGTTKEFTLLTDNSDARNGENGDTTGPYIGMQLNGAVAEQMSFTMYGSILMHDNELSTIKVADNSNHQVTFTVGETFNSDKLNVELWSHLGSSAMLNIENFTTNYDGYTFKSRDVGTKTVTVSWGGTTATYEINVVSDV